MKTDKNELKNKSQQMHTSPQVVVIPKFQLQPHKQNNPVNLDQKISQENKLIDFSQQFLQQNSSIDIYQINPKKNKLTDLNQQIPKQNYPVNSYQKILQQNTLINYSQQVQHLNQVTEFYQKVPKQSIYSPVQQQKNYNQNEYQNNYYQTFPENIDQTQFNFPQKIQQFQQDKMSKQQSEMKNHIISSKINLQSPVLNINKIPIIKKEALLEARAKPMTKNEIDELYSYESAICRIKFQNLKNGQILEGSGTGFFCEIDDDNIPFRKALFTNNHILDKNSIEINKEIVFEICNKIYKIKITKNRKVFTNERYDYTCIEIFNNDNFKKFFKIDDLIFNNKNNLINKEIFILQYPYGELSHDLGTILDIKDNIICHSVNTESGSSGSPLIKRYNNNLIIGIHYGTEKDEITDKYLYNLAIPFDIIIKDIKEQLSKSSKNIFDIQNNNEYRYRINLIYEKKDKYSSGDNPNRIFGYEFVKNNKDNIKLIINSRENQLIENYDLKKGVNEITLIILNKLTNLNKMFNGVCSLKNIEELRYLNTNEVNNFSYMFNRCSSLTDIKPLENWNVSKGNNFSCVFSGCSSLADIKPLENWNVSNGNNFSGMFWGCSSLNDIKPLKNWNVSNGNNFSYMLSVCSSLNDIKPLKNWNVSNGNNFSYMFSECSSLINIKPLENWNVSNGNNFKGMFNGCFSLSDIKPLENWNISNVSDFSFIFNGCSSLKDIKPLQNWDVSNVSDFSFMFYGCSSLTDIKPLQNWVVSNCINFKGMFHSCPSLSNTHLLQNWNVSKSKLDDILGYSFL